MPARSAAWMTVSPSATSTLRPSISSVGMAAGWLRDGPERAAAEGRVLLELRAILRDECPGRHGGGVGQRADRRPHHVAGDVEEEVDVGGRRRPLAVLQASEDLLEPPRALAARRSTMCGTQASVSTLLTIVGQPKRPCVAGNGGLMRG